MIEFPVVLVINCGSSSVKFSVLDASSCDALMTGIADGINTEKAFISVNGGEPARLAHHDYEGALAAIALELEKRNLMSSVALIGHRIAHGGNLFSESTLITEEAIAQIRQVSPLAPLHNYANLSGVEAAERLFPGVQQVAVFDTSFHQTLPPQAYLYGLPYRYFEELGVRRYGFHGTSHRYVAAQAHYRAVPRRQRPGDCPSRQRGVHLRGAQRRKRRHLDGDDAAGRAGDGYALRRRGLRRDGVDCRADRPVVRGSGARGQ